MAIEKKSLVNRASVKTAKIASQPADKPLKVQTLKVEPKGIRA